ncbi:hypothetical protein [Xylanimonas ulmi]|uniref:Helix-turn-helix protein n=1 Tax=Xylanimonas ulmi TaxID=228973 RepID=A0A4Q7M1L1_9MICO|nr:hypothetical protein [Xylanibacterium ulmi]RZS60462.1 hypothetical protein EV386_0720 [Xylanibacterium ulmi]
MLLPEDRIAVGVREAARLVDMSPETIKRAIHTTSPVSFPPPLRAKYAGYKYSIRVADLIEWWESLPDA